MPIVYLDSRDLIELVVRQQPVPADEFGAVLRAKDWRVAFSFANVCETMVVDNIPESMRRARLLGSLPYACVRALTPIRCMEFTEAVRAFESGDAPNPINPFVSIWHQTFLYPHQDQELAALTQIPFEQQVLFIVKNNPDVCRNLPEHSAIIQAAVDEDRTVTNAVRRNRQRTEGGIAQILRDCQIPTPAAGLTRFARWVMADPRRCPGWRLFDECYLRFATNRDDTVDHGDANDWSHVSSLPYVDALTLDRRIAGYARAAAESLGRQNVEYQLSQRINDSATQWFAAIRDA